MSRRSAATVLLGMCLVLGACSSTGGSTAAPTGSIGSASPVPSLATVGQPADDGARIVDVRSLGNRARDLTIESPAVGTVMVRLLLPSTFADQATTRFPTLYLLHGAGGGYTDWTSNTDIERLTLPTNLLVAMPAGSTSGIDGWFSDWETPGQLGKQNWETFTLTELSQLLERNWQAGPDRAVAGLSMGGYGSMVFAGRHPGFFKGAASFSGALDLKTETKHFNDPNYLARWGDPNVDAANWASHDPIVLIPKLKDTALYISFGNGMPGPFDPGRTDLDKLEAWVDAGNEAFVAALAAAGIPATVNAYGPGTHSWPYWEREMHASLPMLLKAVGGTSTTR